MPWFRCPKCTKLFEAGPYKAQTCPACGYNGPARTDLDVALPEGVVGKPRRYPPVLALAILTLGISLFFYYYKAYKEADQQHGREHAGELFWIGLIPVVGLAFQASYIVVEMNRVRRYRRAHGLRSGAGPAAWFTLFVLSLALFVGAAVGLFYGVFKFETDNVNVLVALYVAVGLVCLNLAVAVATYPSVRSLRHLWHVVYEEKHEALPEWMRDVDVNFENQLAA